jgi:hypothetical protein
VSISAAGAAPEALFIWTALVTIALAVGLL